jgi:hypothetical protein
MTFAAAGGFLAWSVSDPFALPERIRINDCVLVVADGPERIINLKTATTLSVGEDGLAWNGQWVLWIDGRDVTLHPEDGWLIQQQLPRCTGGAL